jgi:hypothetical protein
LGATSATNITRTTYLGDSQLRASCRRRADLTAEARNPGSHDDAGHRGSLPVVSADRPATHRSYALLPCQSKWVPLFAGCHAAFHVLQVLADRWPGVDGSPSACGRGTCTACRAGRRGQSVRGAVELPLERDTIRYEAGRCQGCALLGGVCAVIHPRESLFPIAGVVQGVAAGSASSHYTVPAIPTPTRSTPSSAASTLQIAAPEAVGRRWCCTGRRGSRPLTVTGTFTAGKPLRDQPTHANTHPAVRGAASLASPSPTGHRCSTDPKNPYGPD